LLSRADANTNLSETSSYDALNRLTSATLALSPTPLVKSFSYNVLGNLTSKSDVGTYTYPAAGAPQPHAVMSVSGGSISATFSYDPNGNQTAGLGRTIGYTSSNLPATSRRARAPSASVTIPIASASGRTPPRAPRSTSTPLVSKSNG
jgi:hypothetical protein